MLTSIRQFFSPPVFEDDEEKTRAARLFTAIIHTASFINALIILGGLIGRSFTPQTYLTILINWVVLLAMQYPVRRGWVKPAGTVLVVFLSLAVAGSMVSSGTIISLGLIFLILINLMAGLIISRRAGFWIAGLNTLLVFALFQAQTAGLLPPPVYTVSITQVVTFFAGSLLVVMLLNLSLQNLEESLKRARQNEKAVRELASTLEERVHERSYTLTEALRIARMGNWEYDFLKDEFTFNDDFYAMMRTTVEREGGYTMNAAQYTERFVFPEDAPMVGIEIGKSIETTDPNFRTEVDHRVIFGDGEVGYVTVRFRIEKDAAGRTVKSFGANQDITEQKLAELALAANEAQLTNALRIARLGNWEYNFVQDEFTFNDDFYAMMRTTAEREGGYTMNAARYTERFVYPEDAPIVGIEIGKSVETTDPNYRAEVTHRVIFGDGEVGYVIVRFRIVKDLAGRTVKSIGANQDITEQKLAELALATNEAQLAEATRIAQLANWEYDVLRDQFTFNDQFYALMRTTAEREQGYHMSSMEYAMRFVHPEDAPMVGGEIQKALETTDPHYSTSLDHRVIFGDGTPGYVTVRFRIAKDEEGRTIKTFGANQDVTELKRVEAIVAKRAAELETVTQVATAISTIRDPQEILQYVSDLTKARFNFYHAHVYLLDEQDGMLELAAGAGEAGQQMVSQGHAIPLAREQSLVARAARTRQGVVVNDVTQAPDFLPNPLLPETRAELAVPLLVRDQVLGVLDVQSSQVDAFTEEDIRIQTILAAQIAVALENARANEQTTKTLEELRALNRRLIHEGWETYITEKEQTQLGYVFEENQLLPLSGNGGHKAVTPEKTFVQAVELRGEKIGQLKIADAEHDEEDLQTILAAISQGLSAHLENLRLTEEAERRVNELDIINDIGQALASEVALNKILETVTEKLSRAFNANIVYAALYDAEHQMIHIPYMLDHGKVVLDEPSFPYGEGVNSSIIKNRQRIFINQDTERRLLELGAIPTVSNNAMSKSFIGVPLISGENVLGVLTIQDADREGRFSQGDVDLLTTIASNVAVAVQNAQLFAETQKRAEREAKVNLISQKIQSTTTVQGALQTAVQELGLALKARRTVVQLAPQPTNPARK